MRFLEDFRLNKYLVPYLALQKYGPDEAIEMSYNIYSIHAFYSTMEDIKDLENQASFVNNGRRSNVSISLWFLALESLVNCLCKAVCLKEGKDFAGELSGKSVGKRLGFLLDTFPVEGEKMRKSGLLSRINEFLQFRNEIFHDRNIGESIIFHKTNFSPLPFFSNQVDVFQSLLIFLEVCCALRYVVMHLDLMPNISIGKDRQLIFDKMDNTYLSFLKPYFEQVLNKHELTTGLNLEIDHFFHPLPYSNTYFQAGEILPVFQHQQNEQFVYPLNQNRTSIGVELYQNLVSAANKPADHYDSMNFMLDWPRLYAEAQKQSKS